MLSSLTTHISFYYCMWMICSLQDLALRRLIIWRSNCQSSLQWRIWEQQNCKVEFNQPSYWLYFVPNLLVFQQLVTLYLGGFIVRVVSEIEWLNAQECARKQSLVAWFRQWLAAASCQKQHACQACQKLKRHASWSTTGQNRTTGRSVIARLDLVTQSSHESKP